MKKTMLGLLLVVLYPTLAFAQASQLWVARYHNPSAFNDGAEQVAVDTVTGNIYVAAGEQTAATFDSYLTLAYDSSGRRLWSALYHGPSQETDYITGIVVDCYSGNVYVTGQSKAASTHWGFATVAYDSAGNQLWVARYDGPGDADHYSVGIAMDTSTGNVYVTGTTYGSMGGGFSTVAYDPQGNQLWVASYSDSGASVVRGIAVDSISGNVYVIGNARPQALPGFQTVAYDSDGNRLWIRNGFGTDFAGAIAVAVDSGSNVYAVGYGGQHLAGRQTSWGILNSYDATGNIRWSGGYSFAFGLNSPGPIAVDNDFGRLYTAGSFPTPHGYAIGTVGYDLTGDGNRYWAAKYSGAAYAFAYGIAVDSISGNVYVLEQEKPGVWTILAYDSTGVQLWTVDVIVPGADSSRLNGIAVDTTSGHIYVMGEATFGGHTESVVIAYSPSPLAAAVSR